MSPRELAALKTQPKPVGILTLAQQIGVLHRDIEGRNEEMYGLLAQAKKDAGEGGWLKWLVDNREVLGFGERQAQLYLRAPEARASDKARHAKSEKKRRAATKTSMEATTKSLQSCGSIPTPNQTVEITASQRGRRGPVTFAVEWTEVNGAESVQHGYRTLEEALTFCPCSMDPDTVKRVVVPGVRVHNPVPQGMCGHNGSYLLLDGKKVPGSEVPPNLFLENDDEVAPEDETTRMLPETEPVTKQNTVKAPANEQPAPKKFKPGSPRWVEEQVEALCEAASNLQSVYAKLTGYRQERIRKAQKALEHVVRIGANFDRVSRVSLELVRLWNQQGGTQLEDEDLYLMGHVKEAVACVPYIHIRPWKQVIEKVYAAVGVTWFTSEHFELLTDIRGLSDLNEIEREWATAAPEAASLETSEP